MFRNRIIALAVGVVALVAACTKEDVKTTYSRQEQNIETFVKSIRSSVDTAYVVYNKGTSRVVVAYGEGDSLSTGGNVAFYYAGYVLSGSSLSNANLFATNSSEVASAAGWSLSDESMFEVKEVELDKSGFIDGLRYGLEGVKAGQECYVLFSGKYGFGKHPLGTIPANAALAYHIWVESVTND